MFLWDVIHLGAAAGLADREIIFWSVALALLAFAARMAAPLVALDEGAAKDERFEPGQLV